MLACCCAAACWLRAALEEGERNMSAKRLEDEGKGMKGSHREAWLQAAKEGRRGGAGQHTHTRQKTEQQKSPNISQRLAMTCHGCAPRASAGSSTCRQRLQGRWRRQQQQSAVQLHRTWVRLGCLYRAPTPGSRLPGPCC